MLIHYALAMQGIGYFNRTRWTCLETGTAFCTPFHVIIQEQGSPILHTPQTGGADHRAAAAVRASMIEVRDDRARRRLDMDQGPNVQAWQLC